jgi:integrase
MWRPASHANDRTDTRGGKTAAARDGLAHLVFSRLIGESNGERRFTRSVCVAVAGISAAAEPSAAQPAALPPAGWPDGRTVFQKLALEPLDLDRLWLRRTAEAGHAALLPRRIVEAFFPAPLWPWIGAIASLGPGEASAFLERFCRREALREAPITRARPTPGPVSAVTVETILAGGRRLFVALSDLRRRELGDERLRGWEFLPPSIAATDLGAVVVRTDRSAPPLALVRAAFTDLEARVATLTPGSAARRRALRDRTLLALLVTTGARIGALARVRTGDLEPAHVYPDGACGPAVRLQPGKALGPFETRVKGLPAEVAGWMGEYLESLHARAGTPLFPASGSPRSRRCMHPSSLTKVLAGEALRGGRQTRAPLLPRPGNACYGYSAHTLRHLAERLAYAVGRELIAREGDLSSALTPQAYADALLDHEIRDDRLGYKDLVTAAPRELLARDAALGIWRIVREESLPRSPKEERVEALRARRRRLLDPAELRGRTDSELLRMLVEHSRLSDEIDDLV